MSPRTKKQFEEIREAKKTLIRHAALELFSREGYYSTSISMIARKAEISKGLIYNYYDSKEDLLREIVGTGLDKIMDLVDPDRDGEVTRNELENMIHGLFESLYQHRIFWSLFFSIIAQSFVMKLVKDQIEKMYDKMYGMLIGYFRKENYEDPVAEAMILGSVFDGIAINYLINMEDYPIESVKKRLIEMYCK